MSGAVGRYGGIPDDLSMPDAAPKAPARRGRKATQAAASAMKRTPAPPTQSRKLTARKKEAAEVEHVPSPGASKSRKVREEGDIAAGVGRSLRERITTVATTIGSIVGPRTAATMAIAPFLLGLRAISQGDPLAGATTLVATALLTNKVVNLQLTKKRTISEGE